MYHAESIDALREALRPARRAGQTVALVPTMGNLHAGHLSLVTQAKQRASRVVASIFVNPMQFGIGEDFEKYPRTLAADADALRAVGCDVLFTPAEREVYPLPLADMARVQVPAITDILCGQFRRNHFDGVTTVVAKLFNMTQPDLACFGEKDYQQLMVIRRMVSDLNFPIEIIPGATQREADGLALSSRNQYLSAEQRAIAPSLYRAMSELRERAQTSTSTYAQLVEHCRETLITAGFDMQYVEIRNGDTLAPAQVGDAHVRVFVAGFLGNTRLIDNLRL